MAFASTINHIGIIGSGKMGSDIFNFLTGYNYNIVWLCIDTTEAELQQRSFIKKLNRQLRSGLIDEQRYKFLQHSVLITANRSDLSISELIIECIWENLDSKKEIIRDITPLLGPDCIWASNSSSFVPSLMLAGTQWRERLIGLHFFYPVKLKNIIEIIRTKDTSGAVINTVKAFCDHIEKKYLLQDEKNAFILNRLFLEVQNEAFRICNQNNLPYGPVDSIVETYLFPEGIFRFFDQVGNDVMLQSIVNYTQQNPQPYKALIDKLEDMCSKNQLGVKTKEGFYHYNGETKERPADAEELSEEQMKVILYELKKTYIAAAKNIVSEGICGHDMLEFAAREYLNSDKGPFSISLEN